MALSTLKNDSNDDIGLEHNASNEQNEETVGPSEDREEDNDIFINPADGLPSEHPTLPSYNNFDESDGEVDADSFDDLPRSIIVTNIHSEVFMNPQLKKEMEELFQTFSDSPLTFQWLRSFRRLRVNYDNAIAAANARIKLHQYNFNGKTVITCYFAQPVTPVATKTLQPPAPVKQFLISPPASPPTGWEPREENEPLVNHDLLAALASLAPGESHELHPQTENHPAIIVHTALLPDNPGPLAGSKGRIMQTKCPERV